MSSFEFVSHEFFPEDQYTKESVILSLEGKYRVTYVRKILNSGAMFWSVISSGVSKNGKKQFINAFEIDSNFLNRNIINYLNQRPWESKSKCDQKLPCEANSDELPF